MRARFFPTAIIPVLLGFAGWHGTVAADLSAEEISRRASQVDKVQDWRAQAHIQIIYADGTVRTRDGQVANRLPDDHLDQAMRLYRFDSPADIEGTSLLIHENSAGDDDLWFYLPAIGKSRRIMASDKKNSFVGTEFAYVDLMTQQVADYDHTQVGRESIDGTECYVIDSAPKTPQLAEDIGYSKQRAWIRADNFATLRVDYYDLKGQLLKMQQLSNLQPAGAEPGKWIAARRQMKNLQSEQQTVIAFEGIAVDTGISAQTFSPSRLGRH